MMLVNPKNLNNFVDEWLAMANKIRTLSHQYGIASKKIYELKCENALLREKLYKSLKDEAPTREARVFTVTTDAPPRDITLRSSTKHYSTGQPFTLKYDTQGTFHKVTTWWSFDNNGKALTNAPWEYWVKQYGPFTEVLDVAS